MERPWSEIDDLERRKYALGLVNNAGDARTAVLLLAEVLARLDQLEQRFDRPES